MDGDGAYGFRSLSMVENFTGKQTYNLKILKPLHLYPHAHVGDTPVSYIPLSDTRKGEFIVLHSVQVIAHHGLQKRITIRLPKSDPLIVQDYHSFFHALSLPCLALTYRKSGPFEPQYQSLKQKHVRNPNPPFFSTTKWLSITLSPMGTTHT